jgi:hypothetical protein
VSISTLLLVLISLTSSVESGANRLGVKKSLVFLEVTIGGDCDGEEDDNDRERLFSLLLVFLLVTILFFTILIGDTVGFGFDISQV